MVERNLAKVEVASSNLVFRSNPFQALEGIKFLKVISPARVVELVDTQDLKSCDLKSRAGSIPAPSTSPGTSVSGLVVFRGKALRPAQAGFQLDSLFFTHR